MNDDLHVCSYHTRQLPKYNVLKILKERNNILLCSFVEYCLWMFISLFFAIRFYLKVSVTQECYYKKYSITVKVYIIDISLLHMSDFCIPVPLWFCDTILHKTIISLTSIDSITLLKYILSVCYACILTHALLIIAIIQM